MTTETERQPDPHAGHGHLHDGPCDGGCWLVEFLARDDGWGIQIKNGPDGERVFVLESYPWGSIEEAQSRAQFIMSELDAAIMVGVEIPQESIEFYKIHPPINYPPPQ